MHPSLWMSSSVRPLEKNISTGLHSSMLFRASAILHQVKATRKFTPQPPRFLNEARLTTVDRKICSMQWDGRSQISITLQDRASSLTFPMSLRRNAGKFLSCFMDGGMISLKSSAEPPMELLVGSDKGVLYFSMKGPESTITTGLATGEAATASSLIQYAEQTRIDRVCH